MVWLAWAGYANAIDQTLCLCAISRFAVVGSSVYGPARRIRGYQLAGRTAPDVSDKTWLGAVLAIGGFLFGLIGFAALIWKDPTTLLAILAGAAITLSITLWIAFAGERRRRLKAEADIRLLEIDLNDARRQAAEWSATSSNISVAVKSVLELMGGAPTAAPARVPRPKADNEEQHRDA